MTASPLSSFLHLIDIDNGTFFVNDLFRRKFGHDAPTFGRHMILLYKSANATFSVASYLHLWTQGPIGLIGGGCTDGRTIRSMSAHERRVIDESGGLLLQTLRYAFSHYEADLDAFFGHCGNARALQVDLRAGFIRTSDVNLLVRWNRDLDDGRRTVLFNQAMALGSF